ncbi:MAG: secretin N-terminal domain-containing protein, partial [Planctomycetota bacterium]
MSAQDVSEAEATVRLNLPPNVELRLLVDYVSERMGMNILYGDEVARARVTLKAPVEVPVSSLPGVLESALRMNGLALVDADQPGWKRVVAVQGMAASARRLVVTDGSLDEGAPGRAGETSGGANDVVTQVIELSHLEPVRVEQVARPFLTPQGANLVVDADNRLIILTDFRSQVELVAGLIKRLDQPTTPPTVVFVPARHVPAPRLAQSLNQLIAGSQRLQGGRGGGSDGGFLEVTADERSNRLVLVGTPGRVEQARRLVEELDTDLGLETRIYALSFTGPDRLDDLVRRLIDPMAVDRLYVSTGDPESGYLVVSATPGIHDQVAELKEQIDVPLTEVASPVRFYKLQNADAAEVLATIRAIEGDAGMAGIDLGLAPGTPPG